MSDMVKDWLAECTDGRVSKQTQQVLVAFANWQADRIAAMQADAAPAICTWAPPCGGMAQNCSWKPNDHKPCSCQHPPVVAHKTPETSVKLRDAVEVYQQAYVTWVSDQHKDNAAAYTAAAAVIEADREAVRAEQAAELAKFKALVETLAEALEAIRSEAQREEGSWLHLKRCIAAQSAEALRQYKEACDAS